MPIRCLQCVCTSAMLILAVDRYSTIWLARALPEDGRIVTAELEKKHADVRKPHTIPASLHNVTDPDQ